MSVLSSILKEIKNPYATIAKDGLICGDIHGYVDSGSYALNALVSGDLRGGYPKGKVTALAGEKGTGKTFLLLKAIKESLDADPEAEVLFFESEGALTKNMLIERGIDVDRVAIFPVSTLEDFRNQAVNTLDLLIDQWEATDELPNVTLCLDSLGMLGSEHELSTAKSGENKADMGKKAQLVKSIFRLITLKLSLLQVPMILTAHTYNGMGKYDPKKLSGGQGVELAASIIVFLSKTGVRAEGKGRIKNLVGNNITFILHKGRLTIEGSKLIIGLDFKEGIKRNNGMVPLLVRGGILKKSGAWYSHGDDKNIAQGEANMYAMVDKFVNDEVLDELQPYVEKLFCYGAVENSTEEDTNE